MNKKVQRLDELSEELHTISVWNYKGEIPDKLYDRRIALQLERAKLLSDDKLHNTAKS